jgi:cation transport ATPase
MARGILAFANSRGITAPEDDLEVRVVPGLGVIGTVVDPPARIALGSSRFMTEQGVPLGPGLCATVADAQSRGLPVTLVGWGGKARGLFVLPAQKVAAIEQARRFHGPVCMIGDGLNDAPALAASDVGIALGCGTDLSRDSASICLLGDDLSQIPWSIELARRTRRIIRWNLIWAFGYNSIGVAAPPSVGSIRRLRHF